MALRISGTLKFLDYRYVMRSRLRLQQPAAAGGALILNFLLKYYPVCPTDEADLVAHGLELRSGSASFWGGGRGHSRGVGPARIDPYVVGPDPDALLKGLELGTLLMLLWCYPSVESMRLRINYAVQSRFDPP